jgi:hypothetical protein
MRFIVMHKVDPKMEAGAPPAKGIIERMGALIGESLEKKIFLDGDGLHRSARRVRVRSEGGRVTVERGPYQGRNELVASMALIRTGSVEEATEKARRIASALGDAEVEVGPVVEMWDLTGDSKPADVVGERFLLLVKGDAEYERGRGNEAALRRVAEELAREGVLLDQVRLAPSATGARLPAGGKGKRTWTDGPFTESKELVAGFSILELPSRADAIAWANRYAEVLGPDNEVDVRALAD